MLNKNADKLSNLISKGQVNCFWSPGFEGGRRPSGHTESPIEKLERHLVEKDKEIKKLKRSFNCVNKKLPAEDDGREHIGEKLEKLLVERDELKVELFQEKLQETVHKVNTAVEDEERLKKRVLEKRKEIEKLKRSLKRVKKSLNSKVNNDNP